MRYIILCLLISCAVITYAQKGAIPQDKIIIDLYADTALKPLPQSFSASDLETGSMLLVKVRSGYAVAFKKQFRQKIKRQISADWFIVESNKIEFQNSLYVENIFDASDNWKLSPTLLSNSISPDKKVIFFVQVNGSNAFRAFINQHKEKAEILSIQNDVNIFRIKTTLLFVKEILLRCKAVLSVDAKLNAPKEESVINDLDNSVNSANLFFAEYSDVKGEGLTASVKENLFDTTDIDFAVRYKATALNSNEITTHATTMATLIGGAGNSFYTGKGIAAACRLTSSSFANLLPDANADYQQYGISVQNHSYGVGIENFYGIDAGAYDESMIANPSLLYIFSAGNSGNLTPADGQYQGLNGFANLTGSFKMAKNIITVGSVDSFYNVPLLSSRGPAYDGRIKPELVAYGNDGSSGAAAITSGTALAAQSAYAQQHNGLLPANALIKAILINSADDVYTPGPDYYSGYGNVNTYRAVKDILSANFFTSTVQQDETKNFAVTVPANAQHLKITLIWNDEPAQANAFTALVNDLDLQLEQTNNNTVWLPWVLNSSANIDSLNQLPKRKRDSLNVTEQITIDDPQPGSYIIHVKGFDITTNAQSFYVVYRWDTLNRFQFISPTKEDHFTSGGNSIFRWSSTYATATTGRLEYSINNGTDWQPIDNNLDLSKKYYQWNTPDIFTPVLARMTIGSDVYVSDTFNFSKQLYPKIGFSCSDSVLIYWSKAPGINQYQVQQLGSKYLQPLTTVSDTSIIIHNSNNAPPYIAVTTVFDTRHTGVNSYTFNYTNQGVGCYISNFLADINEGKHALLQLSLGTTYQVATLQFQELTSNGWATIQTVHSVNNLLVTFEDQTLHNGINTYRAVVTLANGTLIYSATAGVYYFGNQVFVMFPNPVQRLQPLTILSNNFSANTLIIYDITGRKVMQKKISNVNENVDVSQLAKGMYIVVIFKGTEKLFTGKLLVE